MNDCPVIRPGGEVSLGEPEPPAPDPYIGVVIDERYVIESVLGAGGMGLVYRGRHLALDKPVALKILRMQWVSDWELSARFLNEARAASSIPSPHIVDISDFGQLPNGAAYFVMEYLRGVPLSQVMLGTPMPHEQLLRIGRQLAEALGAAHAAGVIHRDLKPDNIFLVEQPGAPDFVKVLDFGIAKIIGGKRLTQMGAVFGTPYYMSPEQAGGTVVDGRADLYSLGVILYELASGRVPFDAESCMTVIAEQLYAPLPRLGPEVHVGLAAVIHRCLEKEPARRYQTMQALRCELDRLRAGLQPLCLSESEDEPDTLTPPDFFATAESVAPPSLKRGGPWRPGVVLPLVLLALAIAAVYALMARIPGAGRPELAARPVELPSAAPSHAASSNTLAPRASAASSAPLPRSRATSAGGLPTSSGQGRLEPWL